jgi:hypothetical protein
MFEIRALSNSGLLRRGLVDRGLNGSGCDIVDRNSKWREFDGEIAAQHL